MVLSIDRLGSSSWGTGEQSSTRCVLTFRALIGRIITHSSPAFCRLVDLTFSEMFLVKAAMWVITDPLTGGMSLKTLRASLARSYFEVFRSLPVSPKWLPLPTYDFAHNDGVLVIHRITGMKSVLPKEVTRLTDVWDNQVLAKVKGPYTVQKQIVSKRLTGAELTAEQMGVLELRVIQVAREAHTRRLCVLRRELQLTAPYVLSRLYRHEPYTWLIDVFRNTVAKALGW